MTDQIPVLFYEQQLVRIRVAIDTACRRQRERDAEIVEAAAILPNGVLDSRLMELARLIREK